MNKELCIKSVNEIILLFSNVVLVGLCSSVKAAHLLFFPKTLSPFYALLKRDMCSHRYHIFCLYSSLLEAREIGTTGPKKKTHQNVTSWLFRAVRHRHVKAVQS